MAAGKVKHKWNSFDSIPAVDGLNNVNNAVVKTIKIHENI